MLAACLWATGCVNLATIAPGTSATDVAASAKPFRVWPEANGASSWEYPLGPAGRHTFMVRVGADGRVTRVDQVLDWPFFNTLHPGMKASEIEHVLGRPYSTSYMPYRAENVMAWRWVETVWPRCFYAYMDPAGSLVRIGVQDEETSDHGVLTSSPC
jgi:hypothetical protein